MVRFIWYGLEKVAKMCKELGGNSQNSITLGSYPKLWNTSNLNYAQASEVANYGGI